MLPDKERPADAILLTYENGQGEPKIFDLAFPGNVRPDVYQATGQKSYEHSGWVQPVRPDQVPPEAQTVRAWAFDLEENRAYPISGALQLQKHP